MTSKLITLTLGVLTFIVPLIYLPGIFDFARHPRLFAIQLCLLICCIVLIKLNKPVFTPKNIFLALGCWTCWTMLTTLWAINPVEALIQAQRVAIFSLVPLVFVHITKKGDLKWIYAIAGFTGASVSIIGICQYFGWTPWPINDIPTVGNPSATFGYRNFAASYLVVLLPATLGFAFTEKTTIKRCGWAIAIVLMALFLIYTRTRGAWLGLMVALLTTLSVLTYLYLRYQIKHPIFQFAKWPVFIALIVLVGLIGLVPDRMQETGKFKFDERKTDAVTTLSTAFSPSDARGRLIVWKHTLEMVADYPLFGVGLGSWQYKYPQYDKGDWITNRVAPQRPHNDLLWILSETGLIGFGFFLWFLWTLAYTIWQKLHQSSDTTTIWMLGIGTGLLALIGHSFFSFPQERPAPSWVFWMGVGILATLAPIKKTKPISFRWVYGLAIVLLMCGLSFSYRHIQFDRYYLQSHKAWRAQNWQQLLSATHQATTWGPFNYRIYLLQGAAYQQLDQVDHAITSYKKAQHYHPNEGHAALGTAYLAKKDYGKALSHLRSEYTLYPTSLQVKSDLAQALLQTANQYHITKNHQQAQTLYQEALTLTPNNPRIYNNLGSILLAQSHFPKAEKAFLEALKQRPNYARVYHNLGDLYTAQKDTQRARDAYLQFIQKWQGDPHMIEIAQRKINQLTQLK